ncbi:MAG: hypothetical protein JWQ04_1784, partial [Pedosphaera sp.]|nr:hypothetical protein [Pedosphaera sp.]
MNAQNRVCQGSGHGPGGCVARASRPSPGPSTLNDQPSTTSGRSFPPNQPLSHPQPSTIWSSQPHSANWSLELGYSLVLGAWPLGASQTARSFSPNLYAYSSPVPPSASKPLAYRLFSPISAFFRINKKIIGLCTLFPQPHRLWFSAANQLVASHRTERDRLFDQPL